MVVHKSFFSITFSKLPVDTWLEVVLLKPAEMRSIFIPGRGLFCAYKAYWKFMKSDKVFDLVLPKNKLERAFLALPQQTRAAVDINLPVKMEIMRNRTSLFIRNYAQLDAQE